MVFGQVIRVRQRVLRERATTFTELSYVIRAVSLEPAVFYEPRPSVGRKPALFFEMILRDSAEKFETYIADPKVSSTWLSAALSGEIPG